MIPCYFGAIGLHFHTAFLLFLRPLNNSVGLLHLWLALHMYVWVRVSFYFFHIIGVFKGFEYSNAILVASLLIYPSLLGYSGNFILLFGLLVYRFLVQPFLDSLDLGWWAGFYGNKKKLHEEEGGTADLPTKNGGNPSSLCPNSGRTQFCPKKILKTVPAVS